MSNTRYDHIVSVAPQAWHRELLTHLIPALESLRNAYDTVPSESGEKDKLILEELYLNVAFVIDKYAVLPEEQGQSRKR
jgi:hypothetical protein